jgi:hypothetical protein
MTLRLQSLYEHKMAEIREKQRIEHNNEVEDERPSRRRHHFSQQQTSSNAHEIEVPIPTRSSRLRHQPTTATTTTASASSTSITRFHNLNNSDLYSADQNDTSLNTSGYSTRRSRQQTATASASRTAITSNTEASTSSYFANQNTEAQPGTSSKHVMNETQSTVDLDKSFVSNNSLNEDEKSKLDIEYDIKGDGEAEVEVKGKHVIKEELTKSTNGNQSGTSSGANAMINNMSKRFRVSRADSGTALSSFTDAYEQNSNDYKDTSLNATPPTIASLMSTKQTNGVKSENAKDSFHNETNTVDTTKYNGGDEGEEDDEIMSKKPKKNGKANKPKFDESEELEESDNEDNDDDDDYNSKARGSKRISKKRVDETFELRTSSKNKSACVKQAPSGRSTRSSAGASTSRNNWEDKENDVENDSFHNRTQNGNTTTNSDETDYAHSSSKSKSKSKKKGKVIAEKLTTQSLSCRSSRRTRNTKTTSYCELSGDEDDFEEADEVAEEEESNDSYSSGNDDVSRGSGTKRGRRSQSNVGSLKKKLRVSSAPAADRAVRSRRTRVTRNVDEDSTEAESDEDSSILNDAACNNY